MGKFDKEIAHRREQTRLDEKSLKDYESGTSEDFKGLGNQRVNVTVATIARLRSHIAKSDRLTKCFVKVNA